MNWNILGHDWAVDLLSEQIARKRIRHAYLISGPQGVGRRTLALRLAQALNCPTPPAPGQPCGTCHTCRRLEAMQYPDLTVVQAEQEGGTLKVDQVRELQRTLSLAPYEANYRIALFLRFEEAHPSAANALLKTLEEPPAQVVLILTAESSESLLPTIVSRCEVLRLRSLPVEAASHGLQARWGLPAEQAKQLAHISGGRLGYALRLNEQSELMETRHTWLNDLWSLLHADRLERFAYAATIKDNKDTLRRLLQTWLSFWQDVLLRVAGVSAELSNLDWTNEIESLAVQMQLPAARSTLKSLVGTIDLLERNVNTRLAFEVLLLDLPTHHAPVTARTA